MSLEQYEFVNNGDTILNFFPTGEFSQGGLGTCWFLSTTNSLLTTERGRSLLSSLVEQTPDGNFIVHFAEPFGDTTVLRTQIDNATGATGDIGVAILEQAWQTVNSRNLTYENVYLEPSRALFGTPERETDYWMKDFADVLDWYLGNNTTPDQLVFTLHMDNNQTRSYELTTTSGAQFSIVPQHEYMMTLQQNGNGELICIVENPWYTDRSVEIPFDEISNYFQVFSLYDSKRLPTTREERDARTVQHSYLTNLVGVDNNEEARPGYSIGSAYTPLDNLWSIAINSPETLRDGSATNTDLGDGYTLIIEGNNYRLTREDGSSLFPSASLEELLETVQETKEIDPNFLETRSEETELPNVQSTHETSNLQDQTPDDTLSADETDEQAAEAHDSNELTADQTDIPDADITEPDAEELNSDEPEIDEPEIDEPEADELDSGEPDLDQPDIEETSITLMEDAPPRTAAATSTPLPAPQQTKELLAYSLGLGLSSEYNSNIIDAILYATDIAGHDMPYTGLAGSTEELLERLAYVQENIPGLFFNQAERLESAKAAITAMTLNLAPNESILFDNAEGISAPTGLPNNREPQSQNLG